MHGVADAVLGAPLGEVLLVPAHDGDRLVLVAVEARGEGVFLHVVATNPADGLVIVNPRAAGDPLFASMLDAIRQRLDTNRGYRPLE